MKLRHILIVAAIAAAVGASAWMLVRSHRRGAPAGSANSSAHSASASASGASSSVGTPAATGTMGPAPESPDHFGPFLIAGQNYTVELQRRKIPPGASGEDRGTTVVAMEIRDSAGAVQYRREFPDQADASPEFTDSWSVSAMLLKGAHGDGVLVSYDLYSEPSAPEQEPTGWFQLFGASNGKLIPFGPAYEVQGDLLPQHNPTIGVVAAESSQDGQSDIVKFKVWTGHCRIVFPVRVDWALRKLSPAEGCSTSTLATSAGCRYEVLPEEHLSSADLTFVRLWPAPVENSGKPEKTVVKPDSKVDLLAAQVITAWEDAPRDADAAKSAGPFGKTGSFGVPQNSELWMKVRIDGKEGWMHSEEDFRALGLPEDE